MNSTGNNRSGLQGNGPAIVSSGVPIQTLLGTQKQSNTVMDSDMGRVNASKSNLSSDLTHQKELHSSSLSTTGRGAAIGTGYEKQHLTSGIQDNAMTRSEEVLHVGKEKENLGSASLNKYITSEHVERPVTLTKERLVVERVPVTSSNIDKALQGPDLREAHFDMSISAERAVAMKETVPVERIALRKEIEHETKTVGADLKKEHIDVIDNTRGNLIVNDRVAGQIGTNAVNHPNAARTSGLMGTKTTSTTTTTTSNKMI